MSALLEELLKLAEQLNSEEQTVLIQRLQFKQFELKAAASLSRIELLQKLAHLRESSVKAENTLLGKYANSALPELGEAEFHAELQTIAREWEQELDEFNHDEA